jgi:hypothetical protein
MNRSIALFVALAVLVAHSLAISTNSAGGLASPYDQAFVAYNIASRWVFEGSFSWSPGQSGFASHASPLWVAICAVGERLYLPINHFVRIVGILSTATAFILASRFHSDRVASLITPMLLAISGIMAAAAVSGTETALLTMLVTFAFLAFERNWQRSTGVALCLCGLLRSEAWVLLPVFLFLRYRARRREKRGVNGPPAASLWIFAAPLCGLFLMTGLRWRETGLALPAWVLDLAHLDRPRIGQGLAYLQSFILTAASPFLLLYSLWYAGRRRLSHTGAHALAVFFAWAGIIVVQGGGTTPFTESMVPVLPIALISAQEAMITALNSLYRPIRMLAWASFVGAALASTMASLPPIKQEQSTLGKLQRAWTSARAQPRYGFDDALGRVGLDEEQRATRSLRSIGLFLRDHADPTSTVLTPWPGSIAYLSHLQVRDLLGHTSVAAPNDYALPQSPRPRVDVLAALAHEPDYIVPYWRQHGAEPDFGHLAREWRLALDSQAELPGRQQQLEAVLAGYEVLTIPLRSAGGGGMSNARLPILRKRSLGLTPRISAIVDEAGMRVLLNHAGQEQLADLVIWRNIESGTRLFMTPIGQSSKDPAVRARSNLLLAQTGERPVTLFSIGMDASARETEEWRVCLVNPGSRLDSTCGPIAEEVRIAPR